VKTYICLSHIISQNTPSYGNRDRIILRTNSSIKQGETANSSCWIFSNNHIGTHIDVPYHFSETGKKTFEISVDEFIFNKVQLIDINCNNACLIGVNHFEKYSSIIEKDIELLLIRTGFERFRGDDKYWNDNPGLAPELADYLRKNYPSLRCVGFDFISLTSWKYRVEGRLSHKEFLCPGTGQKAILIIEDMSLKDINSRIKQLIVAPLMVEDGNGGAVTVFAEMTKTH
jgi:kynurenine formamidase